MSSSIKDIEEEIYLIVFRLLNGGTILPNKEQIQSTLEAHLDLKENIGCYRTTFSRRQNKC